MTADQPRDGQATAAHGTAHTATGAYTATSAPDTATGTAHTAAAHSATGAAYATARARRGSRRRRAAALAVPIAVAGVATGTVIGVYVLPGPARPAASGARPVSTAPVVRTNIVNTIQVSALISYAGSYTAVNEASGAAYTWLPATGAVVQRGQALYEVDGGKVTLFYGTRPQWRQLFWGVTPGPDVAQLDRNLLALGYGRGYLTVSDYYTGATAYAVEQWQQATGLPVTGTVPLGQVAFAPGPLRVTSVTPPLGSPPQPGGTVLTATSPDPVVTALLPVTQEYLVHPGDSVTVTLPDGATTTPGRVGSISSVATTSGGNGGNGGPQGAGAPSSGPQAGSSSPDAVTMTVELMHPQAAGAFDQAPVTVNVVSAQARHVLAVPVSALVALAGGGYAVDVVSGSGTHATTRLVPVQTGLFSSTLVQVAGPGLATGQMVEVPSS